MSTILKNENENCISHFIFKDLSCSTVDTVQMQEEKQNPPSQLHLHWHIRMHFLRKIENENMICQSSHKTVS